MGSLDGAGRGSTPEFFSMSEVGERSVNRMYGLRSTELREEKAEGCKLELTRRCSVSHDPGCGFPTKRVRKLAK